MKCVDNERHKHKVAAHNEQYTVDEAANALLSDNMKAEVPMVKAVHHGSKQDRR